MDGLLNILNAIQKESDQEILALEESCRAEREELLQAENARNEELLQIEREKGEKLLQLEEEKGISGAEARKRRLLLVGKQELLQELLQKTLDHLRHMTGEERAAFYTLKILSYAHKEDGELLVSKEDRKTLPASFFSNLNGELKKAGKGALRLQEECTHEGFLLRYGEILENGSPEALMEEHREEMVAYLTKEFLTIEEGGSPS